MKLTKPFIRVSITAAFGLCLFGILLIAFERDIYKWWVGLVTPELHIFQIDDSRRTVIQVYPNTKEIEWYGTKWTDDGQYIEVYASRGQVYYANALMRIDSENPRYSNDTQIIDGENILGTTDELPFTLEDRESLWAGCQKGNLFFTAKYLGTNLWETRLWKGDQLIKTFQPIELHFDLYQSGFNDGPIGWTMEYSHFSPDCRYAVIVFGKDVWLLNTVEKSFSIILTARQFTDNLHDVVEGSHQFIWTSWAPNNQEFVFGDTIYGLEKYNVQSEERSWLLAPGIAGGVNGVLKWSKTGKWILAYSNKGLAIISSTGERMGILKEDCESIGDIAWSLNDKIAFICKDYNRNTCVDGKCPDEKDYLVIWDLANLDSN